MMCREAPPEVPIYLSMQEVAAAGRPHCRGGGVDPEPCKQLLGLGVLGQGVQQQSAAVCWAIQAQPDWGVSKCYDAAGEPTIARQITIDGGIRIEEITCKDVG
jgi:hypothetical protein